MPGVLNFTARLLTVVFVISLRTGAYARVQDQNHLPVARKTSRERGTMFRLAEIVTTGPLFVLAGYTVPGRSGLTN